MKELMKRWKHVFKLDPDRAISDSGLERVCQSGTDAIIVGGTTGVTFDNTIELLGRIRRFAVPCVLEVSDEQAIVPGFDLFLVPIVLNAGDPDWIFRRHQQAIKNVGGIMDWDQVVAEGYVILNEEASAAKLTKARTDLDADDIAAYARLAERMLQFPIFYLEYSGKYGDMKYVASAKRVLGETRIFYGGGITSATRAKEAAAHADTIVVGNVVYENIDAALETVEAVKNSRD